MFLRKTLIYKEACKRENQILAKNNRLIFSETHKLTERSLDKLLESELPTDSIHLNANSTTEDSDHFLLNLSQLVRQRKASK